MLPYAWALAGGQLGATVIVAALAKSSLRSGVARRGILPPFFCTFAGAGILLLLRGPTHSLPSMLKLSIDAAVFGAILITLMRFAFTSELREVLLRIPGGGKLIKLLSMA